MWSHSQGGGGLADALGVPFHILCNSLERHGASHIPFGTPPWERYIYDVFRDTVKEITGYDHDAPVEPEDVVDQLLAEMQEEPRWGSASKPNSSDAQKLPVAWEA